MIDVVGAPQLTKPDPSEPAAPDTSNPTGKLTETALPVTSAPAAVGVNPIVHTAAGVADTFVLGENVTPVTEAADATLAPNSNAATATNVAPAATSERRTERRKLQLRWTCILTPFLDALGQYATTRRKRQSTSANAANTRAVTTLRKVIQTTRQSAHPDSGTDTQSGPPRHAPCLQSADQPPTTPTAYLLQHARTKRHRTPGRFQFR